VQTTIRPIVRATLGMGVVEQLSRLIQEGTFRPGEKLPPERQMAQNFGVARGPVREALRALALAGLIAIVPGKGTFVAEKKLAPHPNEIRAYIGREIRSVRCVYEARRVIESFMVELAADRIGAKGIAALEHYMEEMRTIAARTDPDLKAFAESHYRFDLVVADACGNPVLTGIFKSLREVELETHLKILGLSGRIENSIKMHELLLKAIRSKNRRDARIASKRHFDAALRFFDKLLETEEAKE
jgi:GntR family transcriptional regulator, transcriptional repressor for pyruvate dehydrogenase complex